MTDTTMARFSHDWLLFALAPPIVFGIAAYYMSILRERLWRSVAAQRAVSVLRVGLFGLLGVSGLFALSALFHAPCNRLVARSASCLSNVKALSMALMMYTQDYDERFPPTKHWSEGITKYLPADQKSSTFQCPSAKTVGSYGLSAVLGGRSLEKIDHPASTVLLFEADGPIRSFSGGAHNLVSTRHGGTVNLSFADGHAKWVNTQSLPKLNWSPTATAPMRPLEVGVSDGNKLR